MRRLRRKNAGIRIVRERSAQILGSARNAEVRRRLGGYMGKAWSARANDALERGLRPAPMIADELGVSAEAVEAYMRSPEWHHVGEDFEEVRFFDPDEAPLTDAKDVRDAETAQSFLTYVDMFNYDTRKFSVEPRVRGKFEAEASDKAYALFTNRSTAVAKDAFAAADKLRALIEGGTATAEELRAAAEEASAAAKSGRKASDAAAKSFLSEHKDWRRVRPRRARRGANGLRYSLEEAFPATEEEREGIESELTPEQWVTVRTRAFKEWFGDWEKAARIEKLRDSVPVEISGREIEEGADIKSYRKNAKEYGSRLRGTYLNRDTGKRIAISMGGINEVLSHDASPSQFKSIAAIPQMVENGIYIESRENEDIKKHPDVGSYDYFVCGLKIGGVDYTAKIVVANQRNGERYYDHKLTQIEKGALLSTLSAIHKAGEESNTPLSEVKDKRLLSILQANSSKIVDENGEPLVVWHGTREHFYEFEHGRAFGSGDIYGYLGDAFYATNDYETAESYADGGYKRTLGLFLNIRNPYETKNPDHTSPAHGGSFAKHLGVSPREVSPTLRQMGHDGVIATDEEAGYIEYAFYHSTQAKSATENVGTFDAGNPDIRYSISPLYAGAGQAYWKPDLQFVGSGTGGNNEGRGLYSSGVLGVARDKYAMLAVKNSDVDKLFVVYRGETMPLKQALEKVKSVLNEQGEVNPKKGTEEWIIKEISYYLHEYINTVGMIGIGNDEVISFIEDAFWGSLPPDYAEMLKNLEEDMRSPIVKRTMYYNEKLKRWSEFRLFGGPRAEERDVYDVRGKYLDDYKDVEDVKNEYDRIKKLAEEQGDELKEARERIEREVEMLHTALPELRFPLPAVMTQTWWTNRPEGDVSHLLSWFEAVTPEQMGWILDGARKAGFSEEEIAFLQRERIDGNDVLIEHGNRMPSGREMYMRIEAIARMRDGKFGEKSFDDITAKDLWKAHRHVVKRPGRFASEFFVSADIDGMMYPVDYRHGNRDGRTAGWNYVAFSDEHLRVDAVDEWNPETGKFKRVERNPDIRYSLSMSEQAAWDGVLDAYEAGTLPQRVFHKVLNRTPVVLQRLGLKNRPITIRKETIDKIIGKNPNKTGDYHNVPIPALRELLRELDNPVAVFESVSPHAKKAIVVLTELTDEANGEKAIVPVEIDEQTGAIKSHRITSAYGRPTKDISKWIASKKILYANTKKLPNLLTADAGAIPATLPEGANKLGSEILTEKDFTQDELGVVKVNNKILRNSAGLVYGYWDEGSGELHLNEDFADFDTPLHEWAHVWLSWVRKADARLAERALAVTKETRFYKRLREDKGGAYAGLSDDALAEERGACRISSEAGFQFSPGQTAKKCPL